jgi:dolichol-phosphate mannosyltransferase
VLCGLSNTDSDAYVVIDADCEDPPELITTFVSKWEEGYDIVYGQRAIRPENHAIVAARRLFYRLTHLIADWEFIIDMAEFSLFSDRVRRQVLRHRSTFPFVRSDLAFAGFRRHGIPYAREPRRFGETHYNLIRMTKFAIGGILSASTFPLRAIAYFGFPLAAVDLVYAFVALFGYRAGLTSIAILNLAFVVTSLAFLAMYIARIAKDVIGRPVFVIDAEQTHLNRPLDSESDLHYQTQARNV